MTHNDNAITRAAKLGADDGKDAASWVFDGNTSDDTYASVLTALREGDSVLDMPEPDLSGQWADGVTAQSLAKYASWTDDDTTELCDAYEQGFREAVEAEIMAIALRHMNGVKEREIENLSVYDLARLADCAGPDSDDSPGGKFLDGVRIDVLESHSNEPFGSYGDYHDTLTEIADGAPSVYTHKLWTEFTDLSAYEEDISDLIAELPDSLDQIAAVALYQIALRLAAELAGKLDAS